MREILRRFAPLLLAVAVLAVVVAGCGGDDDEGSSSGTTTGSQVPGGGEVGEGEKGGSVTFLSSGDVDFMDPGQSYYTFGYMVQYATNRSLYSFSPDNATEPLPDLADGEPEISADNKTITVKIKSGIKYAPPVDREVTSKDVKYAIERAFTTSVPSGYATSYFAEIEGAPAAPVKIAKLKPFPGLETPDDNTLVIKLTKAVAPRVAAALVMPITMPVPEEYAAKFDKKAPSEYNTYVAFTGPYMVKNDPETGELTGWDIGKRMELVRNPNWDAETDYRPAFLDSITIQMGNDDATVANRRTLSGSGLMCCDSGQPPPAILSRALRQFEDQLGTVPSGGGRWVAFNSAKPPFDNVNVRRAAIAVADRNALRLTRGGEAVGPIAQHWLPPGLPGHEESGGEEGFTEFDWMQTPEGDLELAKKYLKAAADDGAVELNGEGLVDGTEITMVGDNVDPGQQTSQVAQNELEKLGFEVRLTKVPRDTMYTKFCGVPKNQPNVCPTVGWFKDFTDAESMLEPTFDGKAIKPAGNVNWTQLDVPEINEAMAEAALLQGSERHQAWADVNKMIVEQAPGIPYIWDTSYQLQSPDVNGVMSSYSTSWDLSFSSLK